MIIELVKGYYEYRKCPKCKSSFFDVRLIKTNDLGPDFKDKQKHIYRNYYECKRCNHHWSTDDIRAKKEALMRGELEALPGLSLAYRDIETMTLRVSSGSKVPDDRPNPEALEG